MSLRDLLRVQRQTQTQLQSLGRRQEDKGLADTSGVSDCAGFDRNPAVDHDHRLLQRRHLLHSVRVGEDMGGDRHRSDCGPGPTDPGNLLRV